MVSKEKVKHLAQPRAEKRLLFLSPSYFERHFLVDNVQEYLAIWQLKRQVGWWVIAQDLK